MVNDPKRLTQILPEYFRTHKLTSFFRQLYSYDFQGIRKDNIKVYKNPNFTRGCLHEFIKVKKSKQLSEIEKITQLSTTYSLLEQKYSEMLISAIELRQEVNLSVMKNIEILLSLGEFRFYFTEKIKIMSMMMSINSIFYDSDAYANVNDVIRQQSYIKALRLEPYIEEYKHFEISPDILNIHVRNTLFCVQDYNSYLARLVRATFKSFNDKYFRIPLKRFYTLLLKFILRDQLDKELEAHKNFNYLLKVKSTCNLIFESIIADFTTPNMERYLKDLFRAKDIEIMDSKGNISDILSLNNFSQRSFHICETLSNIDWLVPNLPDFDE